ncbi:alpha/beta fold hydrolase [Nocardia sp. CA-084685]|uniref:alpha/beta fold hydrolase n=1 Tax=Nocardia sp. CA-084685 TaxID=3239970 RepID=UPI003D99F4E6
MPFVTARGARFHTVELGTSGPLVVMLHGLFTGSVASWYLTVAPLLAARCRIRLIDWRGHGLSERTPSGYGSTHMASDLDALTADLEPFAVVGHSFGAIVASRFALTHRDRVTRIVMVDPPLAERARPWWTPDESSQALEQARTAAVESCGNRRAGLALGLVEETTLLAELEAEPALTATDLRELARIPTLIAVGSQSRYRAVAEGMARDQSAMTCRVLPGGHDLHVESRRPLADIVSNFLGVTDD